MKAIVKIILLGGCLFLQLSLKAQIGINNDRPDSTAVLDIYGDERGILIPRIPRENDIITPIAHSLIFYNTTENHIYIFDTTNSEWNVLIPASLSSDRKNYIIKKDIEMLENVISAKKLVIDTLLVNKSAGDLIAGNISATQLSTTENITALGNINTTRNISAGSLNATGSISANTISSDAFISTGNISITDEYNYINSKTLYKTYTASALCGNNLTCHSGRYTHANGSTEGYINLDLPNSAIIQRIQVSVIDNSDANITIGLYRKAYNSINSISPIVSRSTSGRSMTVRTVTFTLNTTVDNYNYGYFLKLDFAYAGSAATVDFVGARVTYSISKVE